jgi:A/G-specific adenine glycosylase
MMELGATVCKPGEPRCHACPVADLCAAKQAGTQRELPVKVKTQKVRGIELHLAIVQRDGHILLVKRSSSDRRLADFWELPSRHLLHPSREMRPRKLIEFRHQIVNDRFLVTAWSVSPRHVIATPDAAQWVPLPELHRLPLTTVTKKALKVCPHITTANKVRGQSKQKNLRVRRCKTVPDGVSMI